MILNSYYSKNFTEVPSLDFIVLQSIWRLIGKIIMKRFNEKK